MPTDTSEPEFPREIEYECPQCGANHVFTDYGREMIVRCKKCQKVLMSRTASAEVKVKPTTSATGTKIKIKTADDYSISGRPVAANKEDAAKFANKARELLNW